MSLQIHARLTCYLWSVTQVTGHRSSYKLCYTDARDFGALWECTGTMSTVLVHCGNALVQCEQVLLHSGALWECISTICTVIVTYWCIVGMHRYNVNRYCNIPVHCGNVLVQCEQLLLQYATKVFQLRQVFGIPLWTAITCTVLGDSACSEALTFIIHPSYH